MYLSLSDWQISITRGRGFKDARLMRNSVQGDVYQKVTVEGLWCHICQTTAVYVASLQQEIQMTMYLL